MGTEETEKEGRNRKQQPQQKRTKKRRCAPFAFLWFDKGKNVDSNSDELLHTTHHRDEVVRVKSRAAVQDHAAVVEVLMFELQPRKGESHTFGRIKLTLLDRLVEDNVEIEEDQV